GVPRSPALDPEPEREHRRDDQQCKQEPGRGERHGAHSAPTCTIAFTLTERPSVAVAVATTCLPTEACVTRTSVPAPSVGGFSSLNATACQPPTSCSSLRHETFVKRTSPG